MATIDVEVILGLWLLSGWFVRGSWAASVVFFCLVAGASLYLALAGQASCGCFGRITVTPWVTLALDVAVVALLIAFRPAGAFGLPFIGAKRLVPILAGAGTSLALVGFIFLAVAHDDPAGVLARLRGERISVAPSVTDLGQHPPGEECGFQIEVTNRTDRTVRIVGGSSTCNCIATKSLPISIAPGESKRVDVSVRFVGTPGRFGREFILFTDDDRQPRIIGRIRGQVSGDAPQAGTGSLRAPVATQPGKAGRSSERPAPTTSR